LLIIEKYAYSKYLQSEVPKLVWFYLFEYLHNDEVQTHHKLIVQNSRLDYCFNILYGEICC